MLDAVQGPEQTSLFRIQSDPKYLDIIQQAPKNLKSLLILNHRLEQSFKDAIQAVQANSQTSGVLDISWLKTVRK